MSTLIFDAAPSLAYLGLPSSYEPSPTSSPIQFLTKHLTHLPPHILLHFSYITTPKQRTLVPPIRNRRLRYTDTNPKELQFANARSRWPLLWEGRERRGFEEGQDEHTWVETEFLQGSTKHVGKLANLLRDYEEERENERVNSLRLQLACDDSVTEEDSDSETEDNCQVSPADPNFFENRQEAFECLIKERFIYGTLEALDYDNIDWDESLDVDDERESQERWFDDDDDDDDCAELPWAPTNSLLEL